MNRIGAAFVLASLLPVCAQAESHRVFMESQQVGDSDGARQQAYYAGYRQAWPEHGARAYWEAAAGLRVLQSGLGRESFQGLRASFAGTLAGLEARAQVNPLFGEHWAPWLGAATLAGDVTEDWRLEAAIERDLVDTVDAARAQNLVNSLSLSADYRIDPEWTLIGGVLLQALEDGNFRRGGSLRLAYAPEVLEGFSLQLRARRLDAEFRGTGYFSPSQLAEYTAALRYRRPVWGERLSLSAQLAAGAQGVEQEPLRPVYSGELQLRGFLTEHWGMETRFASANTGGLDANAADGGYLYLLGMVSVFYAW